MTQTLKTTAQKADGVLDSLAVTLLGRILGYLPQKYKTLVGACLVGSTVIANAIINHFGLFADTKVDNLIIDTLYVAGSTVAALGVVHKNLKADPPAKPQPMTPVGGN